ncbi:ABC transporter permease [Ornithinibacillus halophilus]|nr:ABC transporter permease [Ornithinibacillus halophilus]
MNKFWIILSHTYMTKVKSKSFFISTALILFFIVAIANMNNIIELFSSEDKNKIAVIDESGVLFDPLNQSIESTNEDVELILYENSTDEAKEEVQEGELGALVVLSLDENEFPEASYYANNISDNSTESMLEQQIQQIKVVMATQKAGIDQQILADIYEPITFTKNALSEGAKTSEELNQARGIVYVMLFILYMAVMIYGTMIATDVATEKSSRVMEILVSSASPITHMLAKIVGIALLGLTQIILILAVSYVMILSKKDELTGGFFEYFGIQNTSVSTYVYGIVFFLLGYLLYATLAAMLGSLVSRVEEVQQLITPMTLLIIVAFMLSMVGINMPESNIITVTSFIPFFTPMVMFLRVGMLEVPIWEVALSLGLLIGTIALFTIIGARVYKGGVLMYGKSSSLKDIKKAIALSKKEK